MNAPTPTTKQPISRRRKTIGLVSLLILITPLVLVVVSVHSLCGCENDQPDIARLFVSSEVDTPLLAYKTQLGHFPSTKEGLQALVDKPDGVSGWRGPYLTINFVPKDPWGHVYHYAYPSTHGQPVGKYDCWSLGPDGLDGTADDIGNWPATH